MSDLYANIADIPTDTQSLLAKANVTRAGDPAMLAIRRNLFEPIPLPSGARILEVGAGPGDVLKELHELKSTGEAIGLDPSPVMVETARERHGGTEGLSFVVGDGRDLPFDDGYFDLVLFHTTLVHVPNPDEALAEAFRVLGPGGRLLIFEGDYTTATVALGADDPLQGCMNHAVARMVHDPFFSRVMRDRCAAKGFRVEKSDVHGYLASGDASYFLSLTGRGADFLAAEGLMSAESAARLKEDAGDRVKAGRFFGFISYLSLFATRP